MLNGEVTAASVVHQNPEFLARSAAITRSMMSQILLSNAQLANSSAAVSAYAPPLRPTRSYAYLAVSSSIWRTEQLWPAWKPFEMESQR